MTYQRKVARRVHELFAEYDVIESQWLAYGDRNGPGYAQPDVYVLTDHAILCFEAKLTQCDAGALQIAQLYRPLLTRLYRRPVVGVLACRNIVFDVGNWLVRDPRTLLAEDGNIYTWHYMGR